MNDAAFSSFYCGSAFQHPELSTPTHTLEHDNFSSLTNNCSFFDDEQAFLLNTAAAPLLQFSSSCSGATTAVEVPTTTTYSSIPFVQIHTTDLQQQTQPEKSYRNAFRRKTAEIKSEPIKSEQAEAAKERINATPTPPTRNSSCASHEANNATNNDEAHDIDGGNEATLRHLPAIHQCPSCPFLSLCQLKVQSHIANCFGADAQRQLQCPGCANTFYSIDALNVHLSEDHSLEPHEISTLLLALNQRKIQPRKSAAAAAKKQQQGKSRIFIKNVDCMREPQRESLAQDALNTLTDYMPLQQPECSSSSGSIGAANNNNNNILDLFEAVDVDVEGGCFSEQASPQIEVDSSAEPQMKSQKISIKSVDVLREPALLPFDFQLVSGEHELPLMHDNDLDVEVVGVEQEKPRAPKIYIRNVDILKEPMLLPSVLGAPDLPGMSFNGIVGGQVSSSDVFPATAEQLLTPTGPLPGFETTLPSLANICAEAFPFDSVLSGNGSGGGVGNFAMDNARFSALDLDFGVDFETGVVTETSQPPPPPVESMTAVMEPPMELATHQEIFLQQQQHLDNSPAVDSAPAPAQKQKIFIKNVDILKAPQFQQRHEQQQHHQHQQRGTLHLRTVDELNLMNRNEVEHLIVPNLEHILDLPVDPAAIVAPIAGGNAFRPQLSNSWPSSDGYDLADDLDCIIINTMAPLLPVEPDVDGLQLPVDAAGADAVDAAQLAGPELDTLTQMAEAILIDDLAQLYTPQESSLKHEWPAGNGNLAPADDSPSAYCSIESASSSSNSSSSSSSDMPPLVPVTAAAVESSTQPNPNLTSLPLPPLVPCAAPKPQLDTSAVEKPARIYVASNLLSTAAPATTALTSEQSLAGGTSVRGRPYGAKRSGNAKPRKQSGSCGGGGDAQAGGKCTVNGCVFRFKSPATLDYHRRCHNGALNTPQAMVCPECRSSEFSNWNCLHTHLWRTHQIDMELYCCPLCTFKTPIYSRLVNTHSKIHSEERNYKCEQCGKAFKNTKQLKNHRRLHRTQGLGKGAAMAIESQEPPATTLHRCEDCGAAFSHLKTLREHLCKQRSNERAQCEICQRVVSSKSSLRLHMLTHQTAKRFKCEHCDYEANDHNAFRRHRATHRQQKMYACPHCDYEAIQSTAFQIHVQQKHPELASGILHKCSVCSFSTINPGLLLVHQAKHESSASLEQQDSPAALAQSKIKVEHSLFHAHSSTNAKEVAQEVLTVTLVPADGEQQLPAS